MVNFFILFIILYGIIYFFFIRERRRLAKRMKKIDQWSDFNKLCTDKWSKEILDDSVRSQFINEQLIQLVDMGSLRNDILKNWDFETEKLKLYEKWGKHIPSLMKEFRENKLKKLGI